VLSACGKPRRDAGLLLEDARVSSALTLITEQVRERVRQTWNAGAHGSVAADGAEIKYAETGSFANAKVAARFTAIAGMVCDVAEVVEACPG